MARSRRSRGLLGTSNGTLRALGVGEPSRVRLSDLEDLRRPVVDPDPLPLTFRGKPARVSPASASRTVFGRPSKSKLANQMAFAVPREVVVCAKRQQRKEVLHATGKAGGKVRPPRLGRWSHVHCRRK